MNILAGFETFLYVISSLLFLPVIVGLVLLVFWVVIYSGGFLREYIERKQGYLFFLNKYKDAIKLELRPDVSNLSIRLERLLQEKELELIKSLDRIRFVIRVGPALGLMGTLIPMGIALTALAQGDMPKMARGMVTAFTTTVVGLVCAVIAYLISLVKERWIRADMREMEYMTEMALGRHIAENKTCSLDEKDEIIEKT